ncbi:MAG: tetratricopeptide repeat protein [Candidatus Omnitrophica bacterium]|nr:tetratricopeptide repeat protein [Candidatus Omnitrophota bacterium]
MKEAIVLCVFLFAPVFAGAETIVLKSGKIISGTISEQTPEYIKVKTENGELYFENKIVREVDGREFKPLFPGQTARPESVPEPSFPAAATDATACLKAGMVYASEGKFDEAETEFKKGLELNPSEYNIKGALSILDDLKKGLATREYADNVFKGSLALVNEQYGDAIPYFEKILTIKPEDLDAHYNIGVAYYSLKNYPKAIEFLKKAVELKPDDAEGRAFLGNVYYAAGQDEKARESLLAARALFEQAGDKESLREVDAFLSEISSAVPPSKPL